MLQEDQQRKNIGSVSWTDDGSLVAVLDVHHFVVITITHILEAPTTSVLELLRNLPPVEVISHPTERGQTVTLVALKDIESRVGTKSADSHHFPESDPFEKSTVFVDSFSLSKVKSGIWVHRGSLHEGLELISRMSRSSLNAEDAFNRLFTKYRVSKTVGNMRELLVVLPLNFPLITSIVIIVSSSGQALLILSMVQFLSLREPSTSWLSPSVVILKEHVVQIRVLFLMGIFLGEASWNITNLIQIIRTNLGDVHVNQVTIVSINFQKLVSSEILYINIVLHTDMFMGKNHLWLAMLVAWSLHVIHFQILVFLILINGKEVVLLVDDFLVGFCS